MTAFQLGHISQIWDPLFGKGTEIVITSWISKSFPISDAGLGAIFYLVEAIFSLAGDEKRYRTSSWMIVCFGLIALLMAVGGLILLLLQIFVLEGFMLLVCALGHYGNSNFFSFLGRISRMFFLDSGS
jgi:hypothetical protein